MGIFLITYNHINYVDRCVEHDLYFDIYIKLIEAEWCIYASMN